MDFLVKPDYVFVEGEEESVYSGDYFGTVDSGVSEENDDLFIEHKTIIQDEEGEEWAFGHAVLNTR